MLTYGKQYQPFLTGNKVYGPGGRPFPNIGPSDPTGYRERDMMHAARRAALLRRLKASQQGNYMSPDVNRRL